jgi:predicted metal-dependent HD superfamily phosphohydrolase
MNLKELFIERYLRQPIRGFSLPERAMMIDLCWEAIAEAYQQPHRHYHNLSHIEALISFEDQFEISDNVWWAIWFHDFVYDTHTNDNEEQSQKIFSEWSIKLDLPDMPNVNCRKIYDLIKLSKHENQKVYIDHDANLFLDLDLSILGVARDKFEEYDEQIRKEYSWVPDDIFNAKRKEILTKFRAGPIFRTARMIAQFEEQAQKNLAYISLTKYGRNK